MTVLPSCPSTPSGRDNWAKNTPIIRMTMTISEKPIFCQTTRPGASAQLNGLYQAFEPVTHERHIRSLQGDIGASAAHGDTDIGDRQRGRVINAVTEHDNRAELRLEPAQRTRFFLREQLGIKLVDADSRRH